MHIGTSGGLKDINALKRIIKKKNSSAALQQASVSLYMCSYIKARKGNVTTGNLQQGDTAPFVEEST